MDGNGAIPVTLGDRIKLARETAGISQDELGSRLDVTRAAVSPMGDGRSETGRRSLVRHWRDPRRHAGLAGAGLGNSAGAPTPFSGKVRIALNQEVSVDQAARIFAILNEKPQ